MTALRGRDKRAQRQGTFAAKREPDIWESAPEWFLDLYGGPQSDDDAWRDAIAEANSRSEEVNQWERRK